MNSVCAIRPNASVVPVYWRWPEHAFALYNVSTNLSVRFVVSNPGGSGELFFFRTSRYTSSRAHRENATRKGWLLFVSVHNKWRRVSRTSLEMVTTSPRVDFRVPHASSSIAFDGARYVYVSDEQTIVGFLCSDGIWTALCRVVLDEKKKRSVTWTSCPRAETFRQIKQTRKKRNGKPLAPNISGVCTWSFSFSDGTDGRFSIRMKYISGNRIVVSLAFHGTLIERQNREVAFSRPWCLSNVSIANNETTGRSV